MERHMGQRMAAFTLLELMIVLAIGAILAAFAVPSYQGQVRRAHRMDAVAALYRAAQFIEARPHYRGEALPVGFDQAPSLGTMVYRVKVLPGDNAAQAYVLEAQPVESGPMHGDACGVFVLDASGLRTNRFEEGGMGPSVQTCWHSR
ncbi:type IV pilin protein [Paraburkholderia hayleyella]|uniref:type IV pilin protein n=1 Tax=Paraburkholderia hayleyella TaxID=2152889 RepID=UPI001FEB2EA3|nr:type IV pilin protein [Paraburkholderia hayleyella]